MVATNIIPRILPSIASVLLTVGVKFSEVLRTVDEAAGADEVNLSPKR